MYIHLTSYRIYFMKRNNDKFPDKSETSGIVEQTQYKFNKVFDCHFFYIVYCTKISNKI